MRSSRPRARSSPAAGRKRRKPGTSGGRARKKQKRLDAICDRPATTVGSPPPYASPAGEAPVEHEDPAQLRRSSRVRKAPVILDSSPAPSHRKRTKRGRRGDEASGGGGSRRSRGKGSEVVSVDSKVKKEIVFEEEAEKPVAGKGFSEEEVSDWCSRLRSRVRKGQCSSVSAVGKRKLSYKRSDELFGEDKDSTEAKKEVPKNLDSAALESGRKERGRRQRRRWRRKLQKRDGAPPLLNYKVEKGSHVKAPGEVVVITVLSSTDDDGEKNISEDEARAVDETSIHDECKVLDEVTFPDRKNKAACEEALPLDGSKIAARGGVSEDRRILGEKALSEGNPEIAHKDTSLQDERKISSRRDMPEDRRVKCEKLLSESKSKIPHEEASSHAESKTAFRGDVPVYGRVTNMKAFSENRSVSDTFKDLSEDGGKISPQNVLQNDIDETTEEASLEVHSRTAADKASADRGSEIAINSVPDGECEHREGLVAVDWAFKVQEVKCTDEKIGNSYQVSRENMVNALCQTENGVIDQYANTEIDKLETGVPDYHNILKQENSMRAHQVDPLDRPRVREGRRCSLCGGGSDGKPPKRLILESADSDNEPYNGSSSSEEPNYDLWDGFGDEPEWLGRLLGPIRDRFGIARVWVHQQCAVWSPEVYFAGLGHLKNVTAALCRGRALKCSRCGRPGATIGCRVDRCPKTYHLPCARAENCIFDHRKFLIACIDHRHIFQPQGNRYLNQIKKMKNRKLRLDMRKLSNEAWRKDLETEEKWLENCGEDEEFLKREGKRLHRDLSRITPVYIGGSCSEKDKPYQGWESVAGLQDVIQCMKEVIILPLLYPELFNSLGLTPPRGVLLHGYPGTGKTLVVRALIGECSRGDKRIAYFARKGADCLGKYVGDAERQLRLLFQVAERCQPSIIFFDEIDGLAPCRSKQQDQTHNSVVSTLLSLLDGLKSRGSVVVIGATNRPDAVDPALRRPGRFDREIYFPLPSVKDRSAILSLHTKNWPKCLSGPVLSWIASQTAGYAGADLQALCTQAAMIALKRNCPLHKILASAEKGCGSGQPSLASFTVEERDWLAALACAPPPCSQREAGMAANGVVTGPLPTHLIPCLLQPLSYILISFSFDERIWMPPALFKASKFIKDLITSALQQMRMPIMSWKSHLQHLITKSDIAEEMERNLSCFGLLNSNSLLGPFCMLDHYDDDEHDKVYSQRLQISRSCIHSFTTAGLSVGLEKPSGFRVLIAGTPRSGQQHLAACLLHQFLGHVEIQKVNLATISQEGHGDIIRGITQILLKCMNVGRCVVYMPRLDLWAVDGVGQQDSEESTCNKNGKSSRSGGLDNAAKHCSRAWDSFVEQLDSMSRSSSLIVLATCEMANHDLPVGIREFFTVNVRKGTDSGCSEHTIPRFFVQVDEKFKHSLVINSSVARISHDLVQQYVQLIHQTNHVSNLHKELNVCYNTKEIQEREAPVVGKSETVDKICTKFDSKRVSPNDGTSLREDPAQQLLNANKGQNLISKANQEEDVPLQCHQDSLSRVPANKNTKRNSMFVIATLGYQILQYPHFAELCWVTSKLKEGPCADITGPWTVWPFNSCIIQANSSADRTISPLNSSSLKDKDTGVVRGLIAVGLLAYRGAYTSVREVCFEIRKVLELLVRLISAKIQNGKDRYRFLRLLSQVAYLEDMVNSWAYTFQRNMQIDGRSQISGSSSRHVFSQEMNENNSANCCMPLTNDTALHNSCGKSSDAMQEMMQTKSCESRAAQKSNQSNNIVPELEASCDMSSSAPLLLSSCPDSSNALPSGEETCRSENPLPFSFSCKEHERPKSQTTLPITEINGFVTDLHNVGQSVPLDCSRDVSELCNGSEAVSPSNSDRLITGGQVGDADSVRSRNDNILSFVETCLYDVCADCLQSLHVLTREILTNCLKSSGHSPAADDVHDIVSSCSLNLVGAVRKHFFSQSCIESEEHCSREQHRSLTEDYVHQDIEDIKLNKKSHGPRCFEHIKLFPNECSQHLRKKEAFSTDKNAYDNSPIWPALKFLFRDGILLPSNPPEGVVLHCKFEKLCILPIIEIISLIKQP